ncbi:MAG: PmoA family protein [Verrucomicrobiota bacterium]
MRHIILTIFALAAPAHAQFIFSEKDQSIELHEGKNLITAFRSDYRFPYLYPVHSPSGANVLRNWPMKTDVPGEEQDHPHHRGIWLAHGSVNGHDFWADSKKINPTIRLNSVTQKEVKNDIAHLAADLTWVAEKTELLKETRTYAFSKPNAETLRIDIHSTLTALSDEVVFGDTKEGTFAIRTDRTLRVKGPTAKSTLTNSEGQTNLDAWGKRANWVAYTGPDDLGKPTVVAVIDHPTSFRSPTHWHARDYGLLAANPFGINDFEKKNDKTFGNHTLKKSEFLTLNYTIIIHQGTLETAKLKEIHNSLPKP